MSTVIICPACKARYETKAVIPPEGRKVRCTKCGNVWQATGVVEAAKPAGAPAPRATAAAAPRTPAAPPRSPAVPPRAPAAAPRAPAVAPQPAAPQRPAAPVPPPSSMPPIAAPAAPEATQPNGNGNAAFPRQPQAAPSDASFNVGEDFEADLANAVAGNTPGFWPGATGPAEPPAEPYQDLGSYKSGALVDPRLPQSTIPIHGEPKGSKVSPKVAIGWGALVLLLAILAALLALAPKTVVSALPGTSRLYAMLGKPVSLRGLDIQEVSYVWANAAGTQVLRVKGQVVNLTSNQSAVPPVVISLEDEGGKEISVVTANVSPVGPGASNAFVVEIPSPPQTIKGLKVHFAKAS